MLCIAVHQHRVHKQHAAMELRPQTRMCIAKQRRRVHGHRSVSGHGHSTRTIRRDYRFDNQDLWLKLVCASYACFSCPYHFTFADDHVGWIVDVHKQAVTAICDQLQSQEGLTKRRARAVVGGGYLQMEQAWNIA
jgi:hypothetical protein